MDNGSIPIRRILIGFVGIGAQWFMLRILLHLSDLNRTKIGLSNTNVYGLPVKGRQEAVPSCLGVRLAAFSEVYSLGPVDSTLSVSSPKATIYLWQWQEPMQRDPVIAGSFDSPAAEREAARNARRPERAQNSQSHRDPAHHDAWLFVQPYEVHDPLLSLKPSLVGPTTCHASPSFPALAIVSSDCWVVGSNGDLRERPPPFQPLGWSQTPLIIRPRAAFISSS